MYYLIHWALFGFSIGWIFMAARERGSNALFAAIWGAVFIMSSQFIYINLTGKLPAGLVSAAKEVNENRAK